MRLKEIRPRKGVGVMACLLCMGLGQGDGQRLVSVLRYVLYTLQGTIVFYCAHPGSCPCPVPGPVQCV